jgi:pimeloyl-ACP methyl ester carboxylesterase
MKRGRYLPHPVSEVTSHIRDEVTSHSRELDGQPVFWRSAAGTGAPVLYVHGVPTSSDDWPAFLARTGGIAPDLPGFGRSGKRADLDYTIAGYAQWLERFLDALGIDRVRLVVHDWGVVGLALAQARPERVERLVVMNAVPLLPGYRWHRVARLWRARTLGELTMGATTRLTLRLASRTFNATPGPMPDHWVTSVAQHLDQGTQRAILRLYRSAPPDVLAGAGQRLGQVRCPALVVWGDRDPFIGPRFADAYAAALPGAQEPLHLPDAGHWPWLDRPDVVETVASFLGQE